MATLFHGTSDEAADAIRAAGFINGPVFLTPSKAAAEEYAYGETVFRVSVPDADLLVDLDLPGARLLSVEDANGYSGNDGWTIADYIRANHSVGVDRDVAI